MLFLKTKNYTKTKNIPKIGYVLHGTLGGFEGSVAWLLNSNRPNPTSAHYVIGRKQGQVVQLVRDEDISWHAGNISNPNSRAKWLIPKNIFGKYKNPNDYFIGIEFVWGYNINGDGVVNAYDKTLTNWQYDCAVDIIKRSGIKDPKLLSHKEICDYKSDDMYFAIPKLIGFLNKNKFMQTRYEVTNKETNESYLVTGLRFDTEVVEANTAEVGVIAFANPEEKGELTNDTYTIHQIETSVE